MLEECYLPILWDRFGRQFASLAYETLVDKYRKIKLELKVPLAGAIIQPFKKYYVITADFLVDQFGRMYCQDAIGKPMCQRKPLIQPETTAWLVYGTLEEKLSEGLRLIHLRRNLKY